jgi:hypothetical protein
MGSDHAARGIQGPVRIHKVLSQTFRKAARGVNVAADVDAVVSANVGESKTSRTHVSSRKRVVQRSGRTVVSEEQREQKSEEV